MNITQLKLKTKTSAVKNALSAQNFSRGFVTTTFTIIIALGTQYYALMYNKLTRRPDCNMNK